MCSDTVREVHAVTCIYCMKSMYYSVFNFLTLMHSLKILKNVVPQRTMSQIQRRCTTDTLHINPTGKEEVQMTKQSVVLQQKG